MIAFWIAAAVLSAAAAALMLAMAQRARLAPAEDPLLAVHRRQLAEIDDLAERGLIPEDERKAARAEAGRRLLTAASHRQDEVGMGGRRTALVAAALTPLAALGLYIVLGSPDRADEPFGGRVAAWRAADPAELSPPQMAAVLRVIAAERPRDPEPLKNLAMAQMASGNFPAAAEALRRALGLRPGRADLWTMLGEVFVLQAGGEVGEDARAAFAQALRIDPRSQNARYFVARADIEAGRVEQGLAAWETLLDELAAGDPRAQALRAEIGQVKSAGGLKPLQADEPQDMGPAIRQMVDGLAARLAASPDDAEGWVRLVRAYTVLGETEKRDAALARARGLFKARPEVLEALDSAARPQ
ncbi:MAG TPA: c-type cytochrome biogenesis protein CcmI [Caulobacteraceae bacterium]|nr:c-type cytochrome biogenesis protein CcmI [Caulobacteraceae bacterium]